MSKIDVKIVTKAYQGYINGLDHLRDLFLLAIRLYWGWQFFLAGKGKLANIERTTEFFQSLNLPLPQVNAVMAGSIEALGGLLLMAGLGARLVSLPLAVTMIVAYLTAEREALSLIFAEPDRFFAAAPFLFLLAALTVLFNGAGRLSLDALSQRLVGNSENSNEMATQVTAKI